MFTAKIPRTLAIAMWDFSWLERRWSGAGYEDWDRVLDELVKRGYDALRIDAYPHFIAANATKVWEVLPFWNQQNWGSPALNRIVVQPYLNQFIEKCAQRGLWVALSSWFSQNADQLRLGLTTPARLAQVWKAALDSIASAGLLQHILYVDLCNEFPLSIWIPAVNPDGSIARTDATAQAYMVETIRLLREAHPNLDYCFSFTFDRREVWATQDVSHFDLLENHIWMTQWTDFYDQVGYDYQQFDPTGFNNLVAKGETLYRADPALWQAGLKRGIELNAAWSRAAAKPLVTTEGWGVVDYKDFPLLDWGWVKELCAYGVDEALKSRRWIALATSNFCGPQFVGMWRDVAWHHRLTNMIHHSPHDWMEQPS
jgi:hypothetical protein